VSLATTNKPTTAIVVSSDLNVVSEAKVDFDADFGAKYGVKKGVLTDEAEGEVFAPVAMWLEAVDLVLRRLRDTGCPLARVRGISGSCQQHGSVFWSEDGERALRALDAADTRGPAAADADDGLLARLSGAFAYQYGPNWQDHSTQAECDLFDAHLGGAHKLAEVTGSAAHHVSLKTSISRLVTLPPLSPSPLRSATLLSGNKAHFGNMCILRDYWANSHGNIAIYGPSDHADAP
jgi:xylulokinase